MQTLKEELEALKKKLEFLKAKRASVQQISKLKEEIKLYEYAIAEQCPEKMIKLTKMDIADRNERINGLQAETEADKKYINLLRRKIKEQQVAEQGASNFEPKQCSIEEFLNNQ